MVILPVFNWRRWIELAITILFGLVPALFIAAPVVLMAASLGLAAVVVAKDFPEFLQGLFLIGNALLCAYGAAAMGMALVETPKLSTATVVGLMSAVVGFSVWWLRLGGFSDGPVLVLRPDSLLMFSPQAVALWHLWKWVRRRR